MRHRRLMSAFLMLGLCIYGFAPCTFAESASLLADNFDTYTSGEGTPPSGWTVNCSDTNNPEYKIYSTVAGRGRSVGFTQYSTATQLQFNRTFAGPSNETYAFEISIKRDELLSDFTISLRTTGTPSAFSIELKSNGSIKACGDAVSSFTYTAGEWLDLKLVFMPGIAKYTFIASQGDNYIAKTANLSGNPPIKDFRFMFPAGTNTAGNTVLIDDVNVYTCNDIVIPSNSSDVTFAQENSSPKNGQTFISTDSKVKIWFNEAVANTDMNGLWTLNGASVDSSRVSLSGNSKCAAVDLNGLLSLGTEYSLNYSGITNADAETLSGSVTFKTAENSVTLADIKPEFNDETDTYTFLLGGKSNTGESHPLKACFAFYAADGSLKDLHIEDISLGTSWESTPVTVSLPAEAALGEVYFVNNMYDMDAENEKIVFLGESTVASSYSGEKELEYTVDYEKSQLTLNGTGAQGKVTVTVLKPGHTSAELSGTGAQADSAIEYMTQNTCDENGTFSVSHVLSGDEGEYTVLVNRHDGDGVKEYPQFVFYMTQESVDIAISDYNSDTADYASLIPSTTRAFNLDLTYYNAITDKSKVYTALKNNRPYTLPEEIRAVIAENALLQAMNEADNSTEFGDLWSENVKLLKLDEAELYSVYADYDDRLEASLSAVLFESDYADLAALEKAFNDNVILCAVAASELYTETKNVLESSFAYLGWDLTEYNLLVQTKSVFTALKGNTYSSLSNLHNAFDDAVSVQANEENKDNSSSSGSGRGGGGSSISFAGSSSVAEQEEVQQAADESDSAQTFTDMEYHAWAQEAVNALAGKGILNGKEEGKFCPSDALKREEMVKLIVGAFESSLSAQAGDIPFTDIEAGAWYAPYVKTAYANGIVNGISENQFGIGAQITRQDLAVMCVRAAEKAGITFVPAASAAFPDADMIAPYARDAVAMLYHAGIMIGDANGAFRPNDIATRAEAAKILYMILQKGMMI